MGYKIENIDKTFNPDITNPIYLIRKNLFKKISHYAPKLKGRLMDFGCGLKPYESLFTVDEYIGVDYEGEGETYEKKEVDVFYDGKTLPFENDYFDSIFSSEVFEHVFNLPDIIIELHRVLKKDGQILITCPFAYGEHEVPNDYARYTSFAIKYMFESNGFEILQFEKTGGNVEAITQLQIVYWNLHILSKFQKIPVLRSVLRKFFFTLHNVKALVLSKILPFRQDLYLNNVILAKKK
jgi:SAM-dependent methyltransferase